MTPDNDPDFDSDPVATRHAAMGPGQEPEPGKSVNRKMKDAKCFIGFFVIRQCPAQNVFLGFDCLTQCIFEIYQT